MELDKIKVLQEEMEKDVYDILRTFELQTQTSVEHISLYSRSTVGNRKPELMWVKIDVEI